MPLRREVTKGFKRDTFEFPAGAAGANLLFQVPEDPGLWAVVVAMGFQVTNDANVANRIVSVQIQQSPKPARRIAAFPSSVATIVNTYNLMLHGPFQLPVAATNTDCFSPLGYNAMEGSFNINIINGNRQAGDIIAAGFVELYRVPFKDLPLFL